MVACHCLNGSTCDRQGFDSPWRYNLFGPPTCLAYDVFAVERVVDLLYLFRILDLTDLSQIIRDSTSSHFDLGMQRLLGTESSIEILRNSLMLYSPLTSTPSHAFIKCNTLRSNLATS